MKMTWVCLVCEKGRPKQWMRSRTWMGICIGCDDQVNDSVVRVLKLRAASPPPFSWKSIEDDINNRHRTHGEGIQPQQALRHQQITSDQTEDSITESKT